MTAAEILDGIVLLSNMRSHWLTAYPDLEGRQLQLVYTSKVSVGATRKDLPGFTLLGCTFLDSSTDSDCWNDIRFLCHVKYRP